MTVIMLLLVLVVSAVSIWSVQQVGKGGEIIMNASSYNCMIHNLRLSFEKVLMPPHDYLIYSDPREIHKFESALKELKNFLVQVTDVIRINERKVADGRERHLAIARKGIVKIEAIAHDIFSISDPLGIEASRLMKEMDASTEHVKQALRELIQLGLRDEQSQAFQPVYEFMISFQSVLMPPHDYLIMGNEAERENYRMLLESLANEMDQIFKLSKPGPEEEVIDRIKIHFKGVTDLASQILAIEDPLKFQGAAKMKQMDYIADQVVMEMETLMAYYKNDAKNAKEMADRTKNASIRFTLIVSFLLVIGGLIGGLLFSFHITNPVRQLLQATKNISAGDLTHKAHVKSRDEIGDLAESFNQMTADLRTYQAQLIHTKEYINNIIKSMIDTLIVVDPDNTIRTVNQAALKMLNYDREEDLVGRPVETIFAQDDVFFGGSNSKMLVSEGSISNYDTVYKTRDSSEIPINLSVSLMKDKEGNLLGTVCVARDMREIQNLIHNLKQAYKELQSTQSQLIQSSKLASMGVLAAGVAHEIINPMNAIINYADLIRDDPDHETDSASYIEGILHEGERITNIVQNLLAFARVDKQDSSPCHIPDIINVSLAFMDAYLAINGIKVQTSYDPYLPRITAKCSQLEQVFINLILNARDALNEKYPHANGNKLIQIEVRNITKEGSPYLRVLFSDNGIGIGQENLDKVFDPFFTTKRSDKGTGLGLSVSYGIIADLKGSIEVKSLSGKQTTFVIDLPAKNGRS